MTIHGNGRSNGDDLEPMSEYEVLLARKNAVMAQRQCSFIDVARKRNEEKRLHDQLDKEAARNTYQAMLKYAGEELAKKKARTLLAAPPALDQPTGEFDGGVQDLLQGVEHLLIDNPSSDGASGVPTTPATDELDL
jgi:hypothetical protein